jgi:uncharacterized RmlC-like cupin family protein
LVEESHHKLVFQNDTIRVFHLKLQPHEATNLHRHKGFYAYISLTPATIGNEVRGRQPVESVLDAGDVHTSKGGFNLVERNELSTPIEQIVVELLKPHTGSFTTPMGGFRYHDAAMGELFEAGGVRAYTMTIAALGRTEPHLETYDRLIVAVSDLTARESVSGEKPTFLELKVGEVKWIARGVTHATTNVGTRPATFVTFEFSTTGI